MTEIDNYILSRNAVRGLWDEFKREKFSFKLLLKCLFVNFLHILVHSKNMEVANRIGSDSYMNSNIRYLKYKYPNKSDIELKMMIREMRSYIK